MSESSKTPHDVDSEVLESEPALPFSRSGGLKRLWLSLQLKGMLQRAGLGEREVRLDLIRILSVINHQDVFKVSLTSQGKSAAGMSATSFNDALIKAVGELCEVIAWSAQNSAWGETRSGWAAGATHESAVKGGSLELIERDSLISHLLCPELKSLPLPEQSVHGLPIKMARLWSIDPSVYVVLAGVFPGQQAPVYLGAACAASLEAAQQKAQLEAVMIYFGYGKSKPETVSKNSRHFLALSHIASSLSSPTRPAVERIFSGGGSFTPKSALAQAQFEVKLGQKFGSLLEVVRVIHSGLCPLSWGDLWANSRVEIERILKSRGLTPQWLVHPFA